MNFVRTAMGSCLLAASVAAYGHGVEAGNLSLAHPWANASAPGDTDGVAYIKDIANKGSDADKLVGASSPIAERVEIVMQHGSGLDAHVMNVKAVSIGAGDHVPMDAGSMYRLTMVNLKQPMKAGDEVPLTLQFERAGKVEVMLHVQSAKSQEAMAKDAMPAQGEHAGHAH